MSVLHFAIPGSIDQLTGGYLFARHLVDGLGAMGRRISVHELAGEFPEADDRARNAAAEFLAALPDDAAAVIDGLALAGFAPSLAQHTARLRLLALVHHPLALESGIEAATARFAALERDLLPRFRGVLAPSTPTAAALQAYGVARERIAVTPPGTLKPAAPRKPAPHSGALRLLSVATVTPRKGHRLLIEALARLGAREWRLVIIGSLARDLPTVAAVRAAIDAHRLQSRVTLAGEWPQAKLGEAYAAADLFVLPSYYEGYGMAFAEALAYGLPIVATRAGAIPETVPDDAALLVPPGDADALAAALARLMDEPLLRAQLGAASAAAGTKLPSWPEAVARWAAASDRLLA